MSLIITTYVPEGIVMASDSRQSITIEGKTPDGKVLAKIDTVNSDNVCKTYLLAKKDNENKPIFEVGVSFFGDDLLGGISMVNHIKRFSEEKVTNIDDITTIPKKLVEFFRKLFPNANTGFHIVGYKKEKKGEVSEPYIYYCHILQNKVERKNLNKEKNLSYGATWSGVIDVLNGILHPSLLPRSEGKFVTIHKPPIVWDRMALQDAIDFSIYAIRTTIDTIRFQARPKNVGGSIDVLVITPDGANWIQRKELKGE